MGAVEGDTLPSAVMVTVGNANSWLGLGDVDEDEIGEGDGEGVGGGSTGSVLMTTYTPNHGDPAGWS